MPRFSPPLVAALAAAALSFAARPASADFLWATVTVDTDTHDDVPGDGICSDASGDCSLRAAVEESNALPSGSYGFIYGPTASPVALTESLHVRSQVQVLDLDVASPCVGVSFYVSPPDDGSPSSLKLDGVNLTNGCPGGESRAISAYSSGELILVESSVTGFHSVDGAAIIASSMDAWIERSVIEGNTNDGGYGGGIEVFRGDLTVLATTFRDNTAYWGGGGAMVWWGSAAISAGTRFEYNNASSGGGLNVTAYEGGLDSVLVEDTYFLGNDATHGGGAFVHVDGAAQFVRSAFFGNEATYGGGVNTYGDGTVELTASSFLLNFAQYNGSAAYAQYGTLEAINCTFFSNQITGPTPWNSGAIDAYDGATVRLGNSLLALNFDPAGGNPGVADCVGSVESLGRNLVSRVGIWGEPNVCDGFSLALGDRMGYLGHALYLHLGGFGVWEDSPYDLPSLRLHRPGPAIDRGDAALCPGFDQDGYAPVDGDVDGILECDVGAYEWGAR